jgi:hypothetical protein
MIVMVAYQQCCGDEKEELGSMVCYWVDEASC